MNVSSRPPIQTLDDHPKQRTPPHAFSDREAAKSFEATLSEATRSMSPRERLFSKFIHMRTIAALSDIIGGTIARPDALLSGAIISFALTLAVYLLAKDLGYSLSGFESVGAFIFGWLLGLVYDFLKLMITGKNEH